MAKSFWTARAFSPWTPQPGAWQIYTTQVDQDLNKTVPTAACYSPPHVLRAHRKLQQNKQLTTGIPLSAARRLPAGKISRKPRGPGAGGRPRRARHSAPGGRPAGGSTRGPLSRCRFRSELWGSACTLPASGASLSPRRRGRGDRSLSPTSSKLFSSHSTPRPLFGYSGRQPPWRWSPLHCATLLSFWRPDGRECGTPLLLLPGPVLSFPPAVLHAGLHKGAFHAASAALCAALEARCGAFTHQAHHSPGADSASCHPDACGVRAPRRH